MRPQGGARAPLPVLGSSLRARPGREAPRRPARTAAGASRGRPPRQRSRWRSERRPSPAAAALRPGVPGWGPGAAPSAAGGARVSRGERRPEAGGLSPRRSPRTPPPPAPRRRLHLPVQSCGLSPARGTCCSRDSRGRPARDTGRLHPRLSGRARRGASDRSPFAPAGCLGQGLLGGLHRTPHSLPPSALHPPLPSLLPLQPLPHLLF